jgi:transposase InsO family protein
VVTNQVWLYLAVILDIWSQQVFGYATSPLIDRDLIPRAFEMARGLRAPKTGLIHHTDHVNLPDTRARTIAELSTWLASSAA